MNRNGRRLDGESRVGAVGFAPPQSHEPIGEEDVQRLATNLYAQPAEGIRLDAAIAENLKIPGFLSGEEGR